MPMESALFGKALGALALALPLLGAAPQDTVSVVTTDAVAGPTHPWTAACEDWDEWDKPGPPFKVYGNTYYVGTCGISAILITSDDGHALIDSGTEAGADVVLANIRKLGFDPKDIKLLLGSHEHFDHVGGMAKIQQATGAVFISSGIAVDTMITGKAHPDDPQFGMHAPMAKIAEGLPYDWGDAPYKLDYFGIVPIPTPGHTPGAMSWSWQACEGEDCLTIVYADSLSAVSRDDYRFSDHPAYLTAFFGSLKDIAEAPCDILLTPHPSGGDLRLTLSALERRGRDGLPTFFCAGYASEQQQALTMRLAKERDAQ